MTWPDVAFALGFMVCIVVMVALVAYSYRK